jgi:hypothetical protein
MCRSLSCGLRFGGCGFHDEPPDVLGYLWDYGVSESSQSVHPLRDAVGYSRGVGWFFVPVPHRFCALRRPISAKHWRLHVVCFLLWLGRN